MDLSRQFYESAAFPAAITAPIFPTIGESGLRGALTQLRTELCAELITVDTHECAIWLRPITSPGPGGWNGADCILKLPADWQAACAALPAAQIVWARDEAEARAGGYTKDIHGRRPWGIFQDQVLAPDPQPADGHSLHQGVPLFLALKVLQGSAVFK